jgi:ketosteroid isomerase-like protein
MSVVQDDPVTTSIESHAIEQLINRYSDAITRADWDQHEAVFAPDATIEVASPFDFKAAGAHAIREQTSAGSARLDFLIHRVDSIVVELLDGDHARATSTIHEMGRGRAPGLSGDQPDTLLNWEQYAVCYDDISKIGGAWKFTRRYCQPIYYQSDAHAGQAVAARSALVRSDSFPPNT